MAFINTEIARLINRTKSTPVLIESGDVSFEADQTINLDAEGTAHEQEGDVFIFHYTRNPDQNLDTEVTVSVNGSADTRIRIATDERTHRDMVVSDLVQNSIYIIYRASTHWHYIGGTRFELSPEFHLFDHVTNMLTALVDDDRFLVGDESHTDQRNTYVTFQYLRALIRASIRKDGTAIEPDPDHINFTGDGVIVAQDSGGVDVTIIDSVKEYSSKPNAVNVHSKELAVVRDSNVLQKAYLKSNRKVPFFDVTVADLGGGHIGYADSGYDSLDDNYDVDAGGTSGYSGIGAISEQLFNLVGSSFTRVGTYTITSSIRGLAAWDNHLYIVRDTGSSTNIRSYTIEDGTQVHNSSNYGSARTPQGFTILNGVGYFYANSQNRFFSYDISATTLTQLSTTVNLTEVVGLANANGNVYVVYRNSSNQYFVAQLDTSDGSLGTGQRLTGYESNDFESQTEGLTSVNNVLYVSTQDAGSGSAHLYSVDPSNGDLTVVGDISPSNADMEHLSQLGDYIYAWNDTDDGIYRAEIQIGIRWVAIFPSTTTEVDDDDTTLKFFPSSGGEEVTLTRDEDITDAIVFASEIVGDPAHTIADGDSESFALYKSDDTQLYEGSDEFILAEVLTKHPIGV